jgi:2-methylcitrate dehydratase PrpD
MGTSRGVSSILVRHIRAMAWEDLPANARKVTARAVMDAAGVMMAASGLGEGCGAFIELAKASGGEQGPSTVLGCSFGTSPVMAAFANGAMAHAIDFEDTHDATLVHPHATVVPAALAIAEYLGGVSGSEFLTAVAIGADLSCRLALGLTESVEKRGYYFIPMLGAYGAAAAAAKLLGLDESQIEQSLALASCQAVYSDALVSYPPSHLRAVRDAFGAKAGVTAALLARSGLQAFASPIEGPGGLYANYARGKYDEARLLDGLGRTFEGSNVSFKPWPSCRGTHAHVEAAIELRRRHAISRDNIESIDVKVSPFFEVLCEPQAVKRRPKTAIDAKFSIPFTVAVALESGTVRLEDFDTLKMNDPALHRLADRTRHAIEQSWTGPQSTRGAIALLLKDGRRFEREIAEPLGHPHNPMSEEASTQKFLDCLRHARQPLAPDVIQSLTARIGGIEGLADMRDLFSPLGHRD